LPRAKPGNVGSTRNAVTPLCARAVDGREHRDDPGVVAVRHPRLRAVEQVAVSPAHRGGRHGGGVGARAGLRDRQGGGHLSGGERWQVPPPLLLRAGGDDGIARRVLHEIDDRGRRAGPRDLLDGQAEGERPEPGAPVGLGNVETHEALRAEKRELLAGIGLGLVDLRRAGRDALTRERARQVAHALAVVGQPCGRLVHRLPLSGGRRLGSYVRGSHVRDSHLRGSPLP